MLFFAFFLIIEKINAFILEIYIILIHKFHDEVETAKKW